MSKRQIAALATVVLVPLAALAVVLVTLLSGDDNGGRPSTQAGGPPASDKGRDGTATTPATPGAPATPKRGLDKRLGQRQAVPAPDVRVPVVDKGSASGPLGSKLAPAVSDGTLDLAELRGTPVVISLWASWCGPCGTAARVVQTESERLGRRGVLFLGLDVQDRESAAQRFRTEFDLSFATARDESGDAARALGATGVPETFFLSDEGKIVGHVIGAASVAQLELGARAAQAGTPLGVRQGGARLPLR
jgi:cytochrome c biogenesis protein CcmG, thiol:disulfide interchange protein DsbE